MQYLLLIYSDESADQPDPSPAELAKWQAVTTEMKEAGVWLGGEALASTTAATTVRVRDGQPLVHDGPFAETKEQLGGFYLIEADNADDALEWARKLPTVTYGSIEVRPILSYPQEG